MFSSEDENTMCRKNNIQTKKKKLECNWFKIIKSMMLVYEKHSAI